MGKKGFLPVRNDAVYKDIEQFELEKEPFTKMGSATFHPAIIPIIQEIVTNKKFPLVSKNRHICWNLISIFLFSSLIFGSFVFSTSKVVGENQIGYYYDGTNDFVTKGVYVQFPWTEQMTIENIDNIVIKQKRYSVEDLNLYVKMLKEYRGSANLLQSINLNDEEILRFYGLKQVSLINIISTTTPTTTTQTPTTTTPTTTTPTTTTPTTTTQTPQLEDIEDSTGSDINVLLNSTFLSVDEEGSGE
jgi:hypothetical protein